VNVEHWNAPSSKTDDPFVDFSIAGETSVQRSLFYGGVGGTLLLVLSFASFLFWRFYSTKR
jgi:hypothetical protein